MGPTVGE